MIDNFISLLLSQPLNFAVSVLVGLVIAAGLRSQLLINENLAEILNKEDSFPQSYSQSEALDKQVIVFSEHRLGRNVINIFWSAVAFAMGFIAAWSL